MQLYIFYRKFNAITEYFMFIYIKRINLFKFYINLLGEDHFCFGCQLISGTAWKKNRPWGNLKIIQCLTVLDIKNWPTIFLLWGHYSSVNSQKMLCRYKDKGTQYFKYSEYKVHIYRKNINVKTSHGFFTLHAWPIIKQGAKINRSSLLTMFLLNNVNI